MKIAKLTSTDGFVAIDLEGAPSFGVVRCARKILQGGAKDMARSQTYAFAAFDMQRGGASAGINAEGESISDALAAFAAEVEEQVGAGQQAFDAGKGVRADALVTLTELDDRSDVAASAYGESTLASYLAALGPVVAAEAALGSLDGKLVAVEGGGSAGPALAAAIAAAGARVVEVTVGSGSIFETEADVLLTGSKMGAINHETAAKLKVKAVVPHAPLPYTARALAVMQAGEIVVVPDFLATAGPLFAWWPDDETTPDSIVDRARSSITNAVVQAAKHDDGMFLGACYQAEAFLATWQDSLPFGRPLAS